MGIHIGMTISKSVTKEEWESVYEETLLLVEKFPFAEKRTVKIQGIDTICLVPTVEQEETYGWHNEKVRVGWDAVGDYTSMKTGEDYYLDRNLVEEQEYDEDAGDALLGALGRYMSQGRGEENVRRTYEVWGGKTQGEPYHMYLLAVAALIEARLGTKAFTFGDITRGQFKKAVEIANRYLVNSIEMPDRCYMDRLLKRVLGLSISEDKQLESFEQLYLGIKDKKFGEYICENFSESAIDTYWRHEFEIYDIGTIGFDNCFRQYMLWGFGLKKLCSFVRFQNSEGNEKYDEFVKLVMDAKLHLEKKNCEDILSIDQEAESPYSVETLFAQFVFGGVRNKKVDSYIPLEEIRSVLSSEFGDKCEVDEIIDAYIQDEIDKAKEQDSAESFQHAIEKGCEDMQERRETYDIAEFEDLKFYEKGDTMAPGLMKSIGELKRFLDPTLQEDSYKELMLRDAHDKCEWLVESNRNFLIRDIDWEKVFENIEKHPELFGRYYSIFRIKMTSESILNMCIAFMINDDLYEYI